MPRATNGKGGKGSDRRPRYAPGCNPKLVDLHVALAYHEISREEFDRRAAEYAPTLKVKCSRCKKLLLQDTDFHKDKSRPSGYSHRCKQCAKETNNQYRRSPNHQRAYELKYYYGISQKDYDTMASAQDNVCAICGTHPEKYLAVDHCHKTGVVRGLLCRTCNSAIGLLKHDQEVIKQAANYLGDFYRDKILRR